MKDSQNPSNVDFFANYPDLLTTDDLQKALGIGRTMAYRLINKGEIKHLRIGKNIRIPKRHIVDFIGRSCYNADSSKSAVGKKEVN